jgi:hypothetical protein
MLKDERVNGGGGDEWRMGDDVTGDRLLSVRHKA